MTGTDDDATRLPACDAAVGGPRAESLSPSPSRRNLLRWAAFAGLSAPIAACARATPGSTAAATTAPPAASSAPGASATDAGVTTPAASPSPSLLIASPDHPVTWPIAADNPAIADGLTPEKGATLQLYNYVDYIDPAAIKSFEAKYKQYGVKVVISTFEDTNEALAKLRAGAVPFDIYFPSYDAIGKLALGGLLRPLTHSYIPNIKNVWPQFQNPFYDGGWQYSVPYTVYTTGISWRGDRVKEDIGARANPYDVFWDTRYSGRISVLDDYREVETMVLLRMGITDINTTDDATLAKVRTALLSLASTTHPKVTVSQYTDLPEGKLDVAQAWSGDAVNMQSYLPSGKNASILRYWFPSDGKGVVNSDLMVVLRGGKNPVLAQLFINHLLDPAVAAANFSAIGYQPPQVGLNPKQLVADQTIPPSLASAAVLPEYFDTGYRTLELPPDVDAKWLANWSQFKAGG